MDGSIDTRLDTILIAVDFNEPSVTAAEWASRIFSGSKISLVNIVEPPPPAPALAMRYPSTAKVVDEARDSAEKKLNELSARIAPGASAQVRTGRPHEEIMKAADELLADVIVVGRQDVGSAGWARVGAIAQRLLRNARTPILVVAGEGSAAPQNILAAVDDSAMTPVVLEWTGALSEKFSTESAALHVLTSTRTEQEMADAQSWLEHRIGDSNAARPPVPLVVSGARRAAEVIVGQARSRGSELIVIGSHGAGSASGLLFGSVAESVVVSAPCPVLVVLATKRTE
ncbi:MAG TPA: universal stress protein [Gemmatimonadaceae bacterium]|nr:universal stress protein [Gemmatimonadaceae bacterium]